MSGLGQAPEIQEPVLSVTTPPRPTESTTYLVPGFKGRGRLWDLLLIGLYSLYCELREAAKFTNHSWQVTADEDKGTVTVTSTPW